MFIQRLVRRIRHLPYRIRRTWGLVRIYWGTIDADWSTIAEVMRYQIRRTRERIAADNIVVGTDRMCRQMLITETLLTRLLDGDYYEIARKRFPNRGRAWALFTTELMRQDTDMLARTLRHLPEWWD